MIDDSIILLVKEIAPNYSLDPALVCAIVEQESDGDTWATRFEQAFYNRYIAPIFALGPPGSSRITDPTEAIHRATSWGLMQVMGETAREAPVNYYGPLPALCDPNAGITVGCKVLQHKLSLASGDVAKALELWNGGADLAYPGQVLARVAPYKASPLLAMGAAPADPSASPTSS